MRAPSTLRHVPVALLVLALSSAARADVLPAPAEVDTEPRVGASGPGSATVDIEEHLGRKIDPDLMFTDQDGNPVRIGDRFTGDRPIVLVLAYYRCPMLCGLVLRGVALAIAEVRLSIGEDFDAITVSIDPWDTPDRARQKRASALFALGRTPRSSWPFLIGSSEAVGRLASEVGFRYAHDPRTDQYAHPAAAVILTPDGRVSRYLYGVSPPARDLRLALIEAGEGKTGGIVDRVIMTCYRYDPAARAYGPYVAGLLRIAGGILVAAVIGVILMLRRRERRMGA